MDPWHLEGPGGHILCGAKHGIIAPHDPWGHHNPICVSGTAGSLCPSCLEAQGAEVDDLRKRAQEREMALQEAAAMLEEGEWCLTCDGDGYITLNPSGREKRCPDCRGNGRGGWGYEPL